MALTTTTLSSAATSTATSIVVASATGFSAGNLILVDGEFMQVSKSYVSGTTIPVQRGLDGTVQAAHVASANVTTGLASDFALPAPQAAVTEPQTLTKGLTSYSASGAISFGATEWTIAVLNGTSALAMTLANPTKDQDGKILTIVGNGKAAHTVTYTAGLGNAGSAYDVGTFTSGGQCSQTLIACNAIWMPLHSPQAGTLTNIAVTWA